MGMEHVQEVWESAKKGALGDYIILFCWFRMVYGRN
jgi:hypothetical protein